MFNNCFRFCPDQFFLRFNFTCKLPGLSCDRYFYWTAVIRHILLFHRQQVLDDEKDRSMYQKGKDHTDKHPFTVLITGARHLIYFLLISGFQIDTLESVHPQHIKHLNQQAVRNPFVPFNNHGFYLFFFFRCQL